MDGLIAGITCRPGCRPVKATAPPPPPDLDPEVRREGRKQRLQLQSPYINGLPLLDTVGACVLCTRGVLAALVCSSVKSHQFQFLSYLINHNCGYVIFYNVVL